MDWKGKLYSHSLRLPPHAPLPTLRPSRSPPRRTLAKIEEGRQRYEAMIDDIIRKHAEEQQLPLVMNKLTRKKSYKSYRIVEAALSHDPKEELLAQLQATPQQQQRKELPQISSFRLPQLERMGKQRMRSEPREGRKGEVHERSLRKYLPSLPD